MTYFKSPIQIGIRELGGAKSGMREKGGPKIRGQGARSIRDQGERE